MLKTLFSDTFQAFKLQPALAKLCGLLVGIGALSGGALYGLILSIIYFAGHGGQLLPLFALMPLALLAGVLWLIWFIFASTAIPAASIQAGRLAQKQAEKLPLKRFLQPVLSALPKTLAIFIISFLVAAPINQCAFWVFDWIKKPFIAVLMTMLIAAPFYIALRLVANTWLVAVLVEDLKLPAGFKHAWAVMRKNFGKLVALEAGLFMAQMLFILLAALPLDGFRVTPLYILGLTLLGFAIAHPGWSILMLTGVLLAVMGLIFGWAAFACVLRTRFFLMCHPASGETPHGNTLNLNADI